MTRAWARSRCAFRPAALLAMLMGLITAPADAGAQLTLGVEAFGDSIEAAPLITARLLSPSVDLGPYSILLEVSLNSRFEAPLFFVNQLPGTNVAFTLNKLLPEKTTIYMRASGFDRSGVNRGTNTSTFVTRSRLRLISPDGPLNVPVYTPHPRFTWSSAKVTTPPGPWVYDLSVYNVPGSTFPVLAAVGLTDTTHVFRDSLEANTSYRWRVTARVLNAGIPQAPTTDSSRSSFNVIADARATIFYQNFPNPFPNPSSASTCFRFTLTQRTRVRLIVRSIRGQVVRTILAGTVGQELEQGVYGPPDGRAGCDPRYAWDGTDSRGRVVPPGVYLAVFEADNVSTVKKMVFLGR